VCDGLIQQPRLARAAFAGDQDHAPGVPGRRGGDGPELVAATDEQLVRCLALGLARDLALGLALGLARGRCVGPASGRRGERLDAAQQLLALTKNGLLDLGQRRTGLQAEFVTQHPPGPP